MSYHELKLVNVSGETIFCNFDLKQDEELLITQYYTEYQRIINSGILKDGLKLSGQFQWDFQGNWSINGELPDDNTIALLLHFIRPFVLNNERCYFNKIINTFSKNIDNQIIRDKLNYFKSLFNGKECQNLYTITINNTVLNSDDFFKKWVNSYEYHRDESKRQLLADIHKFFPKEYTKFHVVYLLVDKIRAIALLGKFISLILKKNKEITI